MGRCRGFASVGAHGRRDFSRSLDGHYRYGPDYGVHVLIGSSEGTDMHYLLPIFKWFGSSWVGAIISGSNWLFPAVEAVHIVALAVLCGAIIMLNLRLFGITLRQKAMAELAEELAPWTFCSLVIIVLTGVMLFSSEAMKAYTNVPF